MLFGTPVPPLVGVMEQMQGIISTVSSGGGGATGLGGQESTRLEVETARTPDTAGGSEEAKRTTFTLARSRIT